jgi:CheY-like chemotaxis protein
MEELPDAILMDVMMPGMSGLHAVEQLQAEEHTRGIPIILFTAKFSVAGRSQLWQGYDIQGVISKPGSTDERRPSGLVSVP